MVRSGIHLELRCQPPSEPVLRQHPFHGLANEACRMSVENLLRTGLANATRVARVPDVRLVAQLLPRQPDTLGVDDDDEVAGIEVRGEGWCVLAAQHRGDARGEAPQHLPIGVGDEPAPAGASSFGGQAPRGVGDRHRYTLLRLWKMTGPTRLELATSGVTGRRSNRLNYDPVLPGREPRSVPYIPPPCNPGARLRARGRSRCAAKWHSTLAGSVSRPAVAAGRGSTFRAARRSPRRPRRPPRR